MINISPIAFYCFAGVALASALCVVFLKNPVSSAFSLILSFFGFAGIYAVLGAHLIAVFQVLVYAGAIMVLFVFVIMLLSADSHSYDLARASWKKNGFIALGCLALAVMAIYIIKGATQATAVGPYSLEAVQAAGGNTEVIAALLFSEYILPFEITSLLLLTAIVATVALAKRKPKKNLELK